MLLLGMYMVQPLWITDWQVIKSLDVELNMAQQFHCWVQTQEK